MFSHCCLPSIDRKLRPVISRPETVVSVRARTYKWHGNNLTSELMIPASLSVNCFSDLGELGWKKISYLFQNRQDTALAPTIPHFKSRVELADVPGTHRKTL